MEQHTVIFLAALSLAILMFWYLGTENPVSKRWVGTVLSVGLSVLCLLGIVPPDRDHLGKIPDALSGKAPWSEVAKLQAGIDIAGGSAFALQLQPSPGRAVDQSSQDKAIEVVRKRLNDLGNKDLSIARRGSDQIVLQMPGVKEADRVQIRETLQKAAKLDFHLVHRESKTLLPKVEAGDLVPGYEVKEVKEKDKSGAVKHDDKVVVTKLPDFEGKYVNRAQPYNNPNKGWVVLLDFDSDGRKLFGDLTGAHVGERLAIVLDGEIVSAPTIQDAITSGNCEISGMGSAEAALNLANALNNPLENSMQIIEEQSVSATLGAAAVHQGVLAGIAGLVVVLLFMMAYYRISGFIAFLALVVNLLVLVGIMAMFQFSFTLPGIAGIVLTVGMAVDSNVLI